MGIASPEGRCPGRRPEGIRTHRRGEHRPPGGYSPRTTLCGPMIDRTLIEEVATDLLPTVVEIRRAIHQHPELSGEEYRTTEVISTALRTYGLTPRVRTPKPGLILDVGPSGPLVGFRSDLDALPIQEPVGLDFASQRPGVMHACGHDAHAAIGLGLALAMDRLALPARFRFLFQPAEETFPGGAFELVREGAVEGLEAILAFHVDPSLDTGRVGLKTGAITSSADRFYVTLEGPGGHTARPHATVDIIHAAGQVVSQLPAMLDRMVDARSPLALVFGKIHGGTADNVIPTTVDLSGTVRTADRRLWDEIPSLVERVIHQIAEPFGAKAIVHYQRGLPPVVNDARVIQRLEHTVSGLLGDEAVMSTYLSMGAEDYSRYLEEVPGALVRLGCRSDDRTTTDLHASNFRLDEECLAVGLQVGIAALAELALG